MTAIRQIQPMHPRECCYCFGIIHTRQLAWFDGARTCHTHCGGPCRICGENLARGSKETGPLDCNGCWEVASRLDTFARSANGKAKLREALNPPALKFTAYAVGRLVMRDGAVVLDGIGLFSEPQPTVIDSHGSRTAAFVVLCDSPAETLEEATRMCRSQLLALHPWAVGFLRERS